MNAKKIVSDEQLDKIIQFEENGTEEEKTSLPELLNEDKIEIERVFEEATSFKEIGESITNYLDIIILDSTKTINKDPIGTANKELGKMNSEVQRIYSDIIENNGAIMRIIKSIPLLGDIAKMVNRKLEDSKFNIQNIEEKLSKILSHFDNSFASVNTSIDIQERFINRIDENLYDVIAYKNYIDEQIGDFSYRLEDARSEEEEDQLSLFIKNVEFFQGNLVVLIGHLKSAKKRLLMRINSATKLSKTMEESRDIFTVLLSAESIKNKDEQYEERGTTKDKQQKTEPVAKTNISAINFIENISKLKNNFDEIETYKKQIQSEINTEKKIFSEAKSKLQYLKSLSKKEVKEIKDNDSGENHDSSDDE